MTAQILVFAVFMAITVRTIGYALYTFSYKNITGGIFLLLLSSAVAAMAVQLVMS